MTAVLQDFILQRESSRQLSDRRRSSLSEPTTERLDQAEYARKGNIAIRFGLDDKEGWGNRSFPSALTGFPARYQSIRQKCGTDTLGILEYAGPTLLRRSVLQFVRPPDLLVVHVEPLVGQIITA